MTLTALEYHTELTDEQRHAVNDWLVAVFGDEWHELRIWRYEVVSEGVVRFHCFAWNAVPRHGNDRAQNTDSAARHVLIVNYHIP